ncbi:MAG: glutaredoxin family protein [Chloroflexota bacterium]|nr:glutaredoxin family protein [Chloroflexota bacterium]
MRSRVVLYVRNGCGLCDEAAALLDRSIGPEGYRKTDVGVSDELLVRYAHRIPVVAVDGIERYEAPITAPDVDELAASLRAAPNG